MSDAIYDIFNLLESEDFSIVHNRFGPLSLAEKVALAANLENILEHYLERSND